MKTQKKPAWCQNHTNEPSNFTVVVVLTVSRLGVFSIAGSQK